MVFEVKEPWAGTSSPPTVTSGLALPPSPVCTASTGIRYNLNPILPLYLQIVGDQLAVTTLKYRDSFHRVFYVVHVYFYILDQSVFCSRYYKA